MMQRLQAGLWRPTSVTEFAFVNSFVADVHNYVPTTVGVAGELHIAIALGQSNGSDPAAPLSPTGWAPIVSASGSSFSPPSFNCMRKVIEASDNSQVDFIGSGNSDELLGVLRFTGPSVVQHVQLGNSGWSGGAPDDQTKTIASESRPVLVIAGYAEMTNNNISGFNTNFSPTEDGEVVRQSTIPGFPAWHMAFRLKFKIYNSAPQNVVAGLDDNGPANLLFSFVVKK